MLNAVDFFIRQKEKKKKFIGSLANTMDITDGGAAAMSAPAAVSFKNSFPYSLPADLLRSVVQDKLLMLPTPNLFINT